VRYTRGTAQVISMGIREGESRSKMISTSAQILTPNLILQITILLPKLRKATMSNQFKEIKPYKVSLDTLFSYRSPQTPLFSLVIPPSDLITVHYLIELLKDILKTVIAISGAIDTPKVTKPQAADSSQPKKARTRALKVEYKTVNKMYILSKTKSITLADLPYIAGIMQP
jgi:hypothetical protein